MSVGYFNRHNFDDWVFIVKAGIYSSMITSQVEERTRQCRNVAEEDMQRFREEAECISEMWQDQVMSEANERMKAALARSNQKGDPA